MLDKLEHAYFVGKAKCIAAFHNERGEVNIIAVILLVLVAIALAALFKDRIVKVVNSLFEKIDKNIESTDLMDKPAPK